MSTFSKTYYYYYVCNYFQMPGIIFNWKKNTQKENNLVNYKTNKIFLIIRNKKNTFNLLNVKVDKTKEKTIKYFWKNTYIHTYMNNDSYIRTWRYPPNLFSKKITSIDRICYGIIMVHSD